MFLLNRFEAGCRTDCFASTAVQKTHSKLNGINDRQTAIGQEKTGQGFTIDVVHFPGQSRRAFKFSKLLPPKWARNHCER
jgi:hypothetical protein